MPKEKPMATKISQIPRIWRLEVNSNTVVLPSGFMKPTSPVIKLGTPIGRVLRVTARLNWLRTFCQNAWNAEIISEYSGVFKPGRFEKLWINGLKYSSIRHPGPNHKNRSSRTGKRIR